MECKKREYDDMIEQKALKRSSYNNRKECIKKKTMELATLCGINACTIIYGPHGEIESWPENPTEARAIIDKFKDLMNDPNKRTTVRDESRKKVTAGVVSCQEDLTQVKDDIKDVPCQRTVIRDEFTEKVLAEPDGEVHSWLENQRGSNTRKTLEENAEIVDVTGMVEKSSLCSKRPTLTGYQEFLKKLESKLGALTKRIEFLRTNQESETNCCCVEKRQLEYSEKTSPKRRRIGQEQEPFFMFDLNYPPPDEPVCSCLTSEDYKDLRLGIV